MTEENKVSKEDTEEPLYFELKDNISSFYISDSDILKCILIADANHKIPTLDNNWIKQAEIYIQKNKKEDYSDKNIAKYQHEADDFYCPECGNCDFCFLFKDSEHEFLISLVLLLFKSGINLLTRFGKTNPINFDKNLNSISGSLSNKKAA